MYQNQNRSPRTDFGGTDFGVPDIIKAVKLATNDAQSLQRVGA